MAKFSFDILFFSSKDLDRVIPITKRFNLKCRFLEHSDGSSYLMKFDSDYEKYEFFKELENIFEFDYQKKDEITLGKYDIRINIRRFQDPYFLDSWGRPLETNENENWYFLKPTNLSIQFPTKKITYNLKGKKRWVWIGATEGVNPETKEEGFIVVATQENSRRPINPSSCYVLTNKIYVTKEKALIDGASHIGGWLKNFSK